MFPPVSTAERFEPILQALVREARAHYGERLVSIAVYGSVGRGTPRPDSDIDVLIVVRDLPKGRLKRVGDFDPVEAALEPVLRDAARSGITTVLSPMLKSPEEAAAGSMIMLDMIEDARLLHDAGDFLRGALLALQARLDRLGTRRVWRGSAWYWDLTPGLRPGEVFEL